MNTNKFSLLRKSALCIFLFSFLFISGMYAQSCNAELRVEKNRNVKSAASADGTTFLMVLTNKGTRSSTYTLSTESLEKSCAVEDGNARSASSNVTLDVSINNGESRSASAVANTVTLRPGQSYNFNVRVNVPKGTPFKQWSCIQVKANSNTCKASEVSTVLKVFVRDPSEG